ncbi:hypothetical protein [Thalassotalea fusca]
MKFSIRLFSIFFAAITLLAVTMSFYPSSYNHKTYDKYHDSVIAMYQETDAQLQKFAGEKISNWSSSNRKRSIYMTFIEVYEVIQQMRIHR